MRISGYTDIWTIKSEADRVSGLKEFLKSDFTQYLSDMEKRVETRSDIPVSFHWDKSANRILNKFSDLIIFKAQLKIAYYGQAISVSHRIKISHWHRSSWV